MARSIAAKKRRRADLARRRADDDAKMPFCCVFGCGRKPDGLSSRWCSRHVAHWQRHGSAIIPTYSAKTISPYSRSAHSILSVEVAGFDLAVMESVAAIEKLYRLAGDVVPPLRLRGLSAKLKARSAISRLRDGGIAPLKIIGTCLSHAALEAEHRICGRPEAHLDGGGGNCNWRNAAIGKRCNRLSASFRYSWGTRRPLPRGLWVRLLGAAMWRASGPAIEAHCDKVLALKIKRYGAATQ
jgi:hypothetical protein